MFVLGLQGSPRLKGNSNHLLSVFMDAAQGLGVRTQTLHVDKKNILPCKEYIVCEKKGFCPIDDDMPHEIYPLIRKADVIVVATPIFFYNTTAQMKALIDRCQTLWARKYRLKLSDPGKNTRSGFLLAVGATRGKNLFEGLKLTTAYFFDAVDAEFKGSITYPGIEHRGDMQKHATAAQEVKNAAGELLKPFLNRKKVMFVCEDNACLSQMASAYAQYIGGHDLDVYSGGVKPASEINPTMQKIMQEDGIDMAFRQPGSVDQMGGDNSLDCVITMGDNIPTQLSVSASSQHWNITSPTGNQIEQLREIQSHIKNRIPDLINQLKSNKTGRKATLTNP